MGDYSLDRHLKAYCDSHEEYQNLYSTWNLNRKNCTEILKTVLLNYPHYSLHDSSHADAIISKIEMLLGERVENLSPTDTWLILHAAYTHDLGMVVQWDEIEEAWNDPGFQDYLTSLTKGEDRDLREAVEWLREMEKDKQKDVVWPLKAARSVRLINASYFRGQHASMSRRYIDRITKGLKIDLGHSGLVKGRLIDLLAVICECHTADEESVLKLPFETDGFGSDYAHPRLVAMLLRLGDLLDVDNGRFNAAASVAIGGLPKTSEAHLEKHEATTHLLITPEKIEFSSDCPDEPSYLEARRFVDYLENEIDFLTKYWVEIVPKDFGGFAPRFEKNACSLCICGVPDAEGLAGLRFEITQKKAFEIIEGASIYEDKLVFLRELLQNAMDASKIQLWRDLCAGTYQAWTGEKTEEQLRNLQPYELNEEIYNSYPIKVRLQTDAVGTVTIEIEDRGTGISIETFKRMCNVGSSVSGSKSLKKEIETMPKWLRPTAGFGIGLQSVFLVVDRFEIETNDGAEKLAATAHSNQTGGYLQIKKNGKRPFRGTTIRVVLGPEKFRGMGMRNEAYKYWRLQYDPMRKENFIHELIVLDGVSDSYRKSIFPIYVESTVPSIGKKKLNEPIPVCKKLEKKGEWIEKEEYLLRFEKEKAKGTMPLEVWDKNEFAYARFEFAYEKNQRDCIQFKGVRVNNAFHFMGSFLSMKLDMYGFDTKECLELSRSALTSEGRRKVNQLVSDLRERYLEILFGKLNHLKSGETFGSERHGMYEFWIECSVKQKARITEEQIKTLVKGETQVIKRGENGFELQNAPLNEILLLGENVLFANRESFHNANGLDQERIDQICKQLQEASEKDTSLKNIMIPINEKLVMTARELYKKSVRRVGDMLLASVSLKRVPLELDEETRTLFLKGLGKNVYTFLGFDEIEGLTHMRHIIPALKEYPELHLSEVPRGIGGLEIRRCGAILSPFDREQAKLAETESCDHFIAVVMASDAFQNAVQWTIDHPANDEKRTPEMVKRAYEKLMREYFDVLRPKDDQ